MPFNFDKSLQCLQSFTLAVPRDDHFYATGWCSACTILGTHQSLVPGRLLLVPNKSVESTSDDARGLLDTCFMPNRPLNSTVDEVAACIAKSTLPLKLAVITSVCLGVEDNALTVRYIETGVFRTYTWKKK